MPPHHKQVVHKQNPCPQCCSGAPQAVVRKLSRAQQLESYDTRNIEDDNSEDQLIAIHVFDPKLVCSTWNLDRLPDVFIKPFVVDTQSHIGSGQLPNFCTAASGTCFRSMRVAPVRLVLPGFRTRILEELAHGAASVAFGLGEASACEHIGGRFSRTTVSKAPALSFRDITVEPNSAIAWNCEASTQLPRVCEANPCGGRQLGASISMLTRRTLFPSGTSGTLRVVHSRQPRTNLQGL